MMKSFFSFSLFFLLMFYALHGQSLKAIGADQIKCKRIIEVKNDTCFVDVIIMRENLYPSFGAVKEKLPENLKVIPIYTAGSTFQFEDQTAKFLFTELPLHNEIKVTYAVIISKRMKKKQMVISGKFGYLYKGTKQWAEMKDDIINFAEYPQ